MPGRDRGTGARLARCYRADTGLPKIDSCRDLPVGGDRRAPVALLTRLALLRPSRERRPASAGTQPLARRVATFGMGRAPPRDAGRRDAATADGVPPLLESHLLGVRRAPGALAA